MLFMQVIVDTTDIIDSEEKIYKTDKGDPDRTSDSVLQVWPNVLSKIFSNSFTEACFPMKSKDMEPFYYSRNNSLRHFVYYHKTDPNDVCWLQVVSRFLEKIFFFV